MKKMKIWILNHFFRTLIDKFENINDTWMSFRTQISVSRWSSIIYEETSNIGRSFRLKTRNPNSWQSLVTMWCPSRERSASQQAPGFPWSTVQFEENARFFRFGRKWPPERRLRPALANDRVECSEVSPRGGPGPRGNRKSLALALNGGNPCSSWEDFAFSTAVILGPQERQHRTLPSGRGKLSWSLPYPSPFLWLSENVAKKSENGTPKK